MNKQKTKKKPEAESNVFNFSDGRRLPLQPKPIEKEQERVSFQLNANVYGLATGDKIICETVFDLENLSRSALVVADSADGRNLMPLSSASIIKAEIVGVVVAFERELKRYITT